MKRCLSLPIRIGIGVGLLVVLFWSIDIRSVGSKLTSIDPVLVIVLCITAYIDRVLMAYKWTILLHSRGVSISVWLATRLYFVGHLLGTFTPGAIGSDAYRVIALAPLRNSKVIASTVFLERFIGLAITGVFAAIGLPISLKYIGTDAKWMVLTIIAIATTTVFGVWISFQPSIVKCFYRRVPYFPKLRITEKLHDFYRVYAESRFHWYTLLAFAALTAVEVVVSIGVIYFAARSIGISVSFGYFLGVMPLLYMLLRLPISFQGIGVQEGLFVYFIGIAGFSTAEGVSISLLLRVAEMILCFLPAGIMLWIYPMRIQPTIESQ